MKKRLFTSMILTCTMAATLGLAGCGSSTASNEPISDDNIKVNQYMGLEVQTVDKTEVTDDLVDSTIQDNLSSNTTYDAVDREAQDGDQVNIDYVGKLDGEAFDGGSAEGYDLTLGSGTFIGADGDYKGFEEQIVGHKAGEKFDIEVKFSDDYGSEDLAGQVATFTITLNEVKEANTPELTDETVATLSSTATTVDEYKEEIKTQLEEQYEEEYNNTLQQEVCTALLDNTTIIGDLQSEIDDYYDQQYSYYESYATMYGTDMDTFCQTYMGMTAEDFQAQLKETAEKSIKFQHACDLIAEDAGLTLSDEEFTEKATALAEEYGYTDSTEATEASTAAEASTAEEASTEAASALDQFLEQYGEDAVRDYLTEEAVMDYLVENCVETDNPTTVEVEETTAADEASTGAEEAATEAAAEAATEAK